MPVACFCKSIRVASIFRIASSSRLRGVSDAAAHIALANNKMKKTNRYIGLDIYGGGVSYFAMQTSFGSVKNGGLLRRLRGRPSVFQPILVFGSLCRSPTADFADQALHQTATSSGIQCLNSVDAK